MARLTGTHRATKGPSYRTRAHPPQKKQVKPDERSAKSKEGKAAKERWQHVSKSIGTTTNRAKIQATERSSAPAARHLTALITVIIKATVIGVQALGLKLRRVGHHATSRDVQGAAAWGEQAPSISKRLSCFTLTAMLATARTIRRNSTSPTPLTNDSWPTTGQEAPGRQQRPWDGHPPGPRPKPTRRPPAR